MQINGGASTTVDTVNGETLSVSPAGAGDGVGLLFRGRQSAATSVQTDLKTCNSVVNFINQVWCLGSGWTVEPWWARSMMRESDDRFIMVKALRLQHIRTV